MVVTLDCGNDFNFHKFLYEKNFDIYKSMKVLNKGDNYIEDYIVTCSTDLYVTLKKEEMDEYYLLHKIDEDNSEIYLVSNMEKKDVGRCNIKKGYRQPKKTFWQFIVDIVT